MVNINATEIDYNLDVNVEQFQLSKKNIKMKMMQNYDNSVLFIYRTKVMPWLTIMIVPMFAVSILIIYLIVRNLVFKKLNQLNKKLKEKVREES